MFYASVTHSMSTAATDAWVPHFVIWGTADPLKNEGSWTFHPFDYWRVILR